MAKDTTPSFIVELRLGTSSKDGTYIEKGFNAGRILFNACLGEALRRLDLMRESKAYRATLAMSKGAERTQAFKDLRSKYDFKDSAIQSFAIQCKNSAPQIGQFLDAHTAQKIATRAFHACDQHAFGKIGRPRFKGIGQFHSLESKTNAAGIRYRDGWLMWGGVAVQCIIDREDEVISHGLSCRIKYCRMVRRRIKDKAKYYAQLIVEGTPFVKKKNKPGKEVVGVDVGPSTIAYVGETKAELVQFCAELGPIEQEIRVLQREMDRSRRASNAGNYKYDGTVKQGAKEWLYSKTYEALRAELAELHRRKAGYRKSLHGKLQNTILRLGSHLRIEKNSYKSFQKNFGRSIGTRAPGMFLTGLIRKAASAGGEVWDIPSSALKLSQLCKCGKLKKKALSERWHSCECGATAQRDLFSAFLARCAEKQGSEYILDTSRVERLWCEVEPLMRQAVSRILEQSVSGGPLPASFGLKALRQSGSPANLMLRSGTGERTPVDVGDAVASCSYRCSESPEKTAVTIRRTPSL